MDANTIAASLDELARYKRGEIDLTTTLVTPPGAEDIDMPIRLDHATLLALAVRAHDMRIPLNDLVVHALELAVIRHSLSLRGTSRNRREGRYVGNHRGGHLRSNDAPCYYGRPDSCVAWLLASQRGKPLQARRPRYTAKAQRHD